MDTITHTVLGACAGEALGGKTLGKKAMLIGAIANNFPDIDVVTSFWMKQSDSLLAHRGFTHSILFALVTTFVGGLMLHSYYSKIKFQKHEWFLLIGINVFLHLIIDSFTVYGTGWYEPFSHHRVAFNILFVADPFFTCSLFVASVALLILKKNSKSRKTWWRAGILIATFYLLYALIHKIQIDQVTKKSLLAEKINYSDFMTTPTPLNNFLWYIVAEHDSGFSIGYRSVFDKEDKVQFHYVTKNDFLLSKKDKEDDDVKKLIRFSEGYYRIQKINDTLYLNDLRFGQIGGWDGRDAPFVFQFKLATDADNSIIIQRGRRMASGKEAFSKMIRRIKGL